MHAWRIRERVMVLAEHLTGSRKTYGINLIGGVRKDIEIDKIDKTMKTVASIKEEFGKLVEAMLSVPQIKSRASKTGVLSRSEARALSVVGPVARASGLYRDIRKDYPYLAYRRVSFKVPLYTEGDNLARLLVRVDEVFESLEIIKQLVDSLPGGSISVEEYEIPAGRKAVAAIEAPRGEDVHFIITGVGRPYRWRVRAPTYQNIPALRAMLRGAPLADAPLTIASIDPCFSCTDRVVVYDVGSGKRSSMRIIGGAQAVGS
jgi:Ni,Fe-hydrogenase III large subunit